MRPVNRLDLRPSGRLAHLPIWVSAGLVAATVASLIFVRVDRVVKGRGALVHSTNAAQVATQRTGVVVEILVADGDRVEAGQPLLRLDDREDRSALESTERQIASTKSELAARTKLRESRRELTDNRLCQIGLDRASTKAACAALDVDAKRLVEDIARRQRDLERNTQLLRKNVLSKADVEETEATLRKARSDHANIDSDLAQKKILLERYNDQELQLSLDATVEDQRESLLVLEAERKLAQLERTAEETRLRLERAVVPAPVTGIVHALVVKAAGELVAERQVVCRLAPPDAELIAEVEVPAEDIGFVREGKTARLKLDPFPFEDYGAFDAVVTLVSADASPTAPDSRERKASYVVRARLSERDATQPAVKFRPGMTLTAELISRRETLGALLFRPLRAAGSELHLDQTQPSTASTAKEDRR